MKADRFHKQRMEEEGIRFNVIRCMEDYAKLKCKEQREICAMQAKTNYVETAFGGYVSVDEDSIKNAPEPE